MQSTRQRPSTLWASIVSLFKYLVMDWPKGPKLTPLADSRRAQTQSRLTDRFYLQYFLFDTSITASTPSLDRGYSLTGGFRHLILRVVCERDLCVYDLHYAFAMRDSWSFFVCAVFGRETNGSLCYITAPLGWRINNFAAGRNLALWRLLEILLDVV